MILTDKERNMYIDNCGVINTQNKCNKRAQMKMQEMAFVLIALVLLFAMLFIFYFKMQSGGIEKTAASLKQERALSLLDKVIAMPELRCSAGSGSESLCLDKDKLEVMAKPEFKEKYVSLFKGIKEVKIQEIYPFEGAEYIIFSSDKADYIEYTAFTRLCKEEYDGVGWQKCSIGIVSIAV